MWICALEPKSRSIGDTCKIFWKVKINGRTADYFFWNGIVNETTSYILSGAFDNQNYSWLCTGKLIHRMVLIEKIRK